MADFFDTNVVVYAFDNAEPAKQAVARRLMRDHPDAVISTQVLLEFYSVLTRTISPSLPTDIALKALTSLADLEVVPADAELFVRAAETSTSHQVSIWDAMIIETARLAGCATLYSEDLQDGLIVRGVSVQNPFAT